MLRARTDLADYHRHPGATALDARSMSLSSPSDPGVSKPPTAAGPERPAASAELGELDLPSSGAVLVTGAAGLLGGAVSRRIVRDGGVVLALDRDWSGPRAAVAPHGIRQLQADVRDTDRLIDVIQAESVGTVIHLAAQTLVGPALLDPVDTFRHNIEGTWSLLEACRRTGLVTSIVVASSDKAYGDWSGRPYVEDMGLRAHHPYDVSKAATDLLARSYALTYGLPTGITRCGNLYGGGDLNWSRIVPGTIRSALEGSRPVIRSDGTLVRDYLHVDDAADAVMRLAALLRRDTAHHGGAFNIAARDRLTALEMVHRVLAAMGSDLQPIIEGRAVQEIPEQRLSATKARTVLGWRPRVRLSAGLDEAIGWYRDHLDTIARAELDATGG